MSTANLVVTNHEAQYFPTFPCVKDHKETFKGEKELTKSSLQFDRILCDVPCSGDGTLRKAPDIWRKWSDIILFFSVLNYLQLTYQK